MAIINATHWSAFSTSFGTLVPCSFFLIFSASSGAVFSSGSSFFSSSFPIFFMPSPFLSFSSLADVRLFVPMSASMSSPGKCRSSQSPLVNLCLACAALKRRCLVLQLPPSARQMFTAACESDAIIFMMWGSSSSKIAATLPPIISPSMSSFSSASAVLRLTVDCLELFHSSGAPLRVTITEP